MLKQTVSIVALLLVASATACQRSPAAREDTEHGREPSDTQSTSMAEVTNGNGPASPAVAGSMGSGGWAGGGRSAAVGGSIGRAQQ